MLYTISTVRQVSSFVLFNPFAWKECQQTVGHAYERWSPNKPLCERCEVSCLLSSREGHGCNRCTIHIYVIASRVKADILCCRNQIFKKPMYRQMTLGIIRKTCAMTNIELLRPQYISCFSLGRSHRLKIINRHQTGNGLEQFRNGVGLWACVI